jgi:hypothetical protein
MVESLGCPSRARLAAVASTNQRAASLRLPGTDALAERPYDLRPARLSAWLNAGVNPPQVAEWADNSVPVLLRVYAKCLTGSEQSALKRIEQAEPDLRSSQNRISRLAAE